jgi:hypothetical protein
LGVTPASAIILAMPVYVTLFVFRVDDMFIRAHECLGECDWYVGEVTIDRARLPRVRPGDRVRLRVAA